METMELFVNLTGKLQKWQKMDNNTFKHCWWNSRSEARFWTECDFCKHVAEFGIRGALEGWLDILHRLDNEVFLLFMGLRTGESALLRGNTAAVRSLKKNKMLLSFCVCNCTVVNNKCSIKSFPLLLFIFINDVSLSNSMSFRKCTDGNI